jgi:hypothetical protein
MVDMQKLHNHLFGVIGATVTNQSGESAGSAIAKARGWYADSIGLRATIQAIPYIGSPLDTLFAGRAAQIHLKRVEEFVHELDQRLRGMERVAVNLDDDAFADLMLTAFERVARTRSEHKRSRFARIITKQVGEGAKWEEAESAVRLLGDLEDVHLEVLGLALAAPALAKGFEGLRVISIAASPFRDDNGNGPVALSDALPHYGTAALRMACAELMAKGLLHDEGIGRWDLGAMQYFVPTDLSDWFAAWIIEPGGA